MSTNRGWQAVVFVFGLPAIACSASANEAAGAEDTRDTPTAPADAEARVPQRGSAKNVCAAYLARVAEVRPESVGPLVHLYGDASPCWSGSAADAEACGRACAAAAARLPNRPEPEGADPLACGSVVVTPDPNRPLTLALRYGDSRGQVPDGISVLLCNRVDPLCTAPLATTANTGAGVVTATIAYGFDGYFEVRPSAAFVPAYRATSQPIQSSMTLDQALWQAAELNAWADAAVGERNVYDSAGHGVVFLSARDCNQKLVPGIAVTTSALDPLMHMVAPGPNGQAAPSNVTGEAGAVAVVNVPPGLHTFTAELAATKKRFGSTRVLVRAGAVTTVDLLPSP